MYNGDVAGFYTKWLRDIRQAQSPLGGYPFIAPRIVEDGDGEPAWGDAGVVVTYNIYRMYGDLQIIHDNYEAMKKWINYILSVNPDFIWTNRLYYRFGDWLNVNDLTSKYVISTGYFAYDTFLLSQMARAIGKMEDAERYTNLHTNISKAFVDKFVNRTDGKILNDTQTSYVIAVAFKILPSDLIPKAMENLVNSIKRHDWHLTTGFIGKEIYFFIYNHFFSLKILMTFVTIEVFDYDQINYCCFFAN